MEKNIININLDLDKELKNIDKEDHYTIPIFIPHKGCKNECVFCNQRKISGEIEEQKVEDVDNIVSEYLSYFKNVENKNIEIAFFGGSFTGINVNEQIKYLKAANKYIEKGLVSGIRISTRPDYISIPILKLMKKYNVTTIELGVQSLDDEVLLSSKRGHTKKDVIRASKLIKLFNINLGHQIMIGLPKSTLKSEIYTIKEVLKISPSMLRIYPVYVIEPSELYDMYLNGSYVPLSLEEAAHRVYSVFKCCQNSDIKIIRIGLQTTEIINSKNINIIGPVCDNFAEYVLSMIVREKIEEIFANINLLENNDKNIIVNITVKSKFVSFISGPNKINKIFFKEKYGVNLKINSNI